MFRINLLVAWRSFLRQKLFSAINVFGLAIGVTCCILIFLLVQQEWSYDKFHENADSIYRVLSKLKEPNGDVRTVAIEPLPLAKALQDEFPGVIHATRFNDFKGAVRFKEKVFTERLLFADPAIFEMFSFPLLAGNPATALTEPNFGVISERMAQKYFGDENPLGRRLTITLNDKEKQDFSISGIAKTIPAYSSIKFDFLLPFTQVPGYDRQIVNWGVSNA